MMGGVSGDWALRPFSGAADHELVEALWLAALEGRWPLLPKAIAMVRDGFFAVQGDRTVGFVAVDLAGSIPLMLVVPGHQRRGIGTDLLSAALDRMRAAGVSTVQAGSGGTDKIWPGVPADLPEAVRLFANCGWRAGQDTLDLVADLPDYRAPALAPARSARDGDAIAPAAP